MLRLDEVSARHGPVRALFGVSLEIPAGRAVALLGRNGAGKSSLMKCAAGLLRPFAGRIVLDGRDVTGAPAHRVNRLGVGYVPEDRRIFAGLTVAENLMVGARPPPEGVRAWTGERIFALFPNLADLRQRRGDRISGGEQRMLSIARALVGHPRLLLLDEPAEGLAPRVRADLAATVATLKAEGLTIVLSEQNLTFARAVADDACVIEAGQVRWRGPMDTLAADPALARAYLAV